MHRVSKVKYQHLLNLSDSRQRINALAIDQRQSLRKMIKEIDSSVSDWEIIVDYKKEVASELTKYATSILLDSEYGLPAASVRAEGSGLLISYEVSGYDKDEEGRLPKLLPELSVKRLKKSGADAVKILLYYDVDESKEINEQKHAFIERVGSECLGEDLPFFLEIVTYDADIRDVKSKEFAKVKPHKVNQSMKIFSNPIFEVDILKMEVPVNMNYVEGYAEDDDYVYSQKEAMGYFKEQSESTHLPFIFLSAGVSAEMFQETLRFAKESQSEFNGVLCGRATWKDSVEIFVKYGHAKTQEWLANQGRQNIEELNDVVRVSATPWTQRIDVL
jgi:tagatose 1,6-diphosphate aldolase